MANQDWSSYFADSFTKASDRAAQIAYEREKNKETLAQQAITNSLAQSTYDLKVQEMKNTASTKSAELMKDYAVKGFAPIGINNQVDPYHAAKYASRSMGTNINPTELSPSPFGMMRQDPTKALSSQIITGQDENGNPIFASNAQAAYDNRINYQGDRLWTNFVKQNDIATASSRSTLGMAGNANIRADRALTILNSPTVTNQDVQMVVADLAGIMQGGSPTDQAMKHSEYKTLQQKIANMQQFISGKPTDAVPEGIKKKLVETLKDLKKMDNIYIKRHIDYQEKAHGGKLLKDPVRKAAWEEMKAALTAGFDEGGGKVVFEGKSKTGKSYQRMDDGSIKWL